MGVEDGRHALNRAFIEAVLAGLRRYEEEITRIVNEYLASIGAPPVKAVSLWPKCAYEDDSAIAGTYDSVSSVIRLYYCPHKGFDAEALAHEIIHHLQNTGHPSVEVKGRDFMDAEALLYPYHERLHEKEAFSLQARVAGELLAKHPRLARILEEASEIAVAAVAITRGELRAEVECRGILVEDWRAVRTLEALAGLLGLTGQWELDAVEVSVPGEPGSHVQVAVPAGGGEPAVARLRITVEAHPAVARFLKSLEPLSFEAGRGGSPGRLSINVEKPFLGPGIFPQASLGIKVGLSPAKLIQAARRRQVRREASAYNRSRYSRRNLDIDAIMLVARLLCDYGLDPDDARAGLEVARGILRSALGNRKEGHVAVELDCDGGVEIGPLGFKVVDGLFEVEEGVVEYAVEVAGYASRMLGRLRDVRNFCAEVWESWRRQVTRAAELDYLDGSDTVEIVEIVDVDQLSQGDA